MAQGQDPDSSRATGQGGGSRRSGIARAGGEAAAQISDVAQQAGRQAREAASSLASQATDQVQKLADRQVSAGAQVVAEVAEAVRVAADNLDESVPQVAQLGRGAADRLDDFSDSIRDLSAAELFQGAADFARRRPAALFGATAICGFLLFRLLTAPRPEDEWDEREDWDDWEDEDRAMSLGPAGGSAGTGAGPAVSAGGHGYGA